MSNFVPENKITTRIMNNRKKKLRRIKSGKKVHENLPFEIMDVFKEPDEWTIITALDRVLEVAENSQLSADFFETCKNPLDFLRQELGLTNIQIVVLVILIDADEPLSWKRLSSFLGLTRLSFMVYNEEIEQLVRMRWLVRRRVHEMSGICQGFALDPGVVNAIRNNKPFVPEKLDGLTEQQFVDRLESYVDRNIDNSDVKFCYIVEWMAQLVKANPDLPLCRAVLKYDDLFVASLLLMVVFDYAQWEGSEEEGLTLGTINNLYPEDFVCNGMRNKLLNGTHLLMQDGHIEYKCVGGQVNTDQYMLTRKAKAELLSAYTPSHSKCLHIVSNNLLLKSHTAIREKSLFFNTSEQQQIDRLTSLLSTENLPSIQRRLEEQGMRKGFACLFYGAPGTGKTETVLQIARQTGRDLMQVDIAGLRDKWVGESEKNIKEVFARYRWLCQNSAVMPILFFNEADAIINKRTENISHSVDKMDNAMQNIILQEIEDLDGILIATTNLTSNLDRAFERRFLYKVEFHKPDTDVKTRIWRSMLKDLSADDARQLASHFDFSGGQIENVARKRTVDYILSGKFASLDEIEGYCRAELLNGKERKSIGFIS